MKEKLLKVLAKVWTVTKSLTYYFLLMLWLLVCLPAMLPSFFTYYAIDNWKKGKDLYFLIWKLLLKKKPVEDEDVYEST